MPRWPLRKAYFWQEAPLLRPLLPLITGIIAYDVGWPATKYLVPIIVCAICSGLLLAGTAFIRKRNKLLDVGHAVLTFLFFASLGWCAYAATDSRNRDDWFGHSISTNGASIVRIAEEPKERTATNKAVVEVLYNLNDSGTRRTSGKALVYVYRRIGMPAFTKGDTLLLPAAWVPVRNNGNPFEFDNVAFQRRKDIRFQQFVSPEKLITLGNANAWQAGFLQKAHLWCNLQLRTYIQDSATFGLLNAMLLGDESGFDPELRQAYSQAGVIHIVSISGSHVAVLFWVITALLFWIKGNRGAFIKYFAGLLLVWLYVLIAGAPPSALRSALMFSVIALSTLSNREENSLNTLAAAAVILLLAHPAWLFTVGFQLSFCAVLSILMFYQPIYRAWPQTNRLGRIIWQAISVSIAAEILTAPLVIYYFNNFPILFIIANLLAAVLVGICALIGGISIIALCWIAPLARGLAWLVTWCVKCFNAGISRLQQYNPESFQFLHITGLELVLIYYIIIAIGVWLLRRDVKGLLMALPAVCILLCLLSIDKYKALRQERLIVYSNGRVPLAERISGQYFSELTEDRSISYDAKAAHIGWHAWKRQANPISIPYMRLAGKDILLLKDTAVNVFTHSLPVDVLIIGRSLRQLRVSSTLRDFMPKEIVLAIRPSAYHLQRWSDSCAAHGIRLVNTAESGAYIIE